MVRLEMKNCNMILTKKLEKYQHYHQVKLDEKLQYDINKKTGKISALSSGKIG